MCGIAGIVYFDGRPVPLAELRAMTDRMLHRGPDDEGFFQSKNAGLGMRRLSIIDLAGGHQPISNEDGTIWVVMNGEIYNFLELRQELKGQGHVFKTECDTEVILHLYEEKGVEALADLNGMFGFALWDDRRRALWVARDRLGIKPLYYMNSGERLLFASDLNGLRGVIDPAVSKESVLQYLALAYVPSPRTIYEGVQKLPPAHYLWIEGERVDCRRYWEVPAVATWRGTPVEAEEQLLRLLGDAVKLQLRSDVPLGVFLSGGLDSSTIVAMAARQLTNPLRTLTIEFPGKQSADAHFAQIVAQQNRAHFQALPMGVPEAEQALDELVPRMDEPVGDSAILPSYLLAKRAREAGLKVLLTGAGGDELFGGYRRHWPARLGSPEWVAEHLPAPLRSAVAAAWSIAQPSRGVRASDAIIAWGTSISGVNLPACRGLLRDAKNYDGMLVAIREEFADLPARQHQHGRAYGRMGIDLRKYLVEDVLAVNDKTTMAASVEGRVPLLDHRLVEFAFALPPEINLLEGEPKGLLRQAMRENLPADLLRRGKEGFNPPLGFWLEGGRNGGCFADELLEDPAPVIDELISGAALGELLNNRNERIAAAPTLFSLLLLNRWLRASQRTRP